MRMVNGKIVLSPNEKGEETRQIVVPQKPNHREYQNKPITHDFISPRPYIPDVVSQERKEYIDVQPLGEHSNSPITFLPELPVEKIIVPPVTQTVMRKGKIVEKTIRKGQVLRRTNVNIKYARPDDDWRNR